MYKYVSSDTLHKSFRDFESYVSKEVERGSIDNSTARSLLASAKKNYKNQNLNRQIEQINAGNTKKQTIYV